MHFIDRYPFYCTNSDIQRSIDTVEEFFCTRPRHLSLIEQVSGNYKRDHRFRKNMLNSSSQSLVIMLHEPCSTIQTAPLAHVVM